MLPRGVQRAPGREGEGASGAAGTRGQRRPVASGGDPLTAAAANGPAIGKIDEKWIGFSERRVSERPSRAGWPPCGGPARGSGPEVASRIPADAWAASAAGDGGDGGRSLQPGRRARRRGCSARFSVFRKLYGTYVRESRSGRGRNGGGAPDLAERLRLARAGGRRKPCVCRHYAWGGDRPRRGRPPGATADPTPARAYRADQTSSLVRTRSTTASVKSVVPACPPRSDVRTPEPTVSSAAS